jgi:hypothetical protein
MNERIEKLWEKANIRYSVYETMKPRDERKIIPEIFAEFLVQECQDYVEHYIRDCGEISSLPDIVIKQPFGVK